MEARGHRGRVDRRALRDARAQRPLERRRGLLAPLGLSRSTRRSAPPRRSASRATCSRRSCASCRRATAAIGDLGFRAFATPHDAAESVAYSFEAEDARIVIASDLGRAEEEFVDFLREATTLLLEMNHDEDMLRDGPYTWPLKKRISGGLGHLSNAQSADAIVPRRRGRGCGASSRRTSRAPTTRRRSCAPCSREARRALRLGRPVRRSRTRSRAWRHSTHESGGPGLSQGRRARPAGQGDRRGARAPRATAPCATCAPGKVFFLEVEGSDAKAVEADARKMAEELLANTVIEGFDVRVVPVKFGIVVFPGSNCDEDCYHVAKDLLGCEAELHLAPRPGPEGRRRRDPAGRLRLRRLPARRRARALLARHGERGGVREEGRPGPRHLQRLPGAARGRPPAGRDADQPRACATSAATSTCAVENDATPFTALYPKGSVVKMPIGHMEGNYTAPPETLAELAREGRVVFRYCDAGGPRRRRGQPQRRDRRRSPASATARATSSA